MSQHSQSSKSLCKAAFSDVFYDDYFSTHVLAFFDIILSLGNSWLLYFLLFRGYAGNTKNPTVDLDRPEDPFTD